MEDITISNIHLEPKSSCLTYELLESFLNDIKNSTYTPPNRYVMITGIGGYLQYTLRTKGRIKIPRKLKKKVYLTKKLRKKYIPEYYKSYYKNK
jgi:uncharacterized protein YybS (DUF2232 family)